MCKPPNFRGLRPAYSQLRLMTILKFMLIIITLGIGEQMTQFFGSFPLDEN